MGLKRRATNEELSRHLESHIKFFYDYFLQTTVQLYRLHVCYDITLIISV